MRTLGVIPARGGSKGVPRKNVRLVAGEPLIAYAITAARQSNSLTDFVVSTDDEEIGRIAQQYGAFVVQRPSELAQDKTPMIPVLLHALQVCEEKNGKPYDVLVLLQPTSPIRTGADVDAVIGLLEENQDVDGVISVYSVEDNHPGWMYRLDPKGWLQPLFAEWEVGSRQNLPPVYHRNGAIYACRRDVVLRDRTLMPRRKKAYVMSRAHSINVNDPVDLVIADVLVKRWKSGEL